MTQAEEVEAAIATAVRETGALHVLFNNAGIFPDDDGSPEMTSEAVWDVVMNVNLKACSSAASTASPRSALRAGARSSIPPRSSRSRALRRAQIAYTASKGGVLAMTREIAVEYARQGIRDARRAAPGR